MVLLLILTASLLTSFVFSSRRTYGVLRTPGMPGSFWCSKDEMPSTHSKRKTLEHLMSFMLR